MLHHLSRLFSLKTVWLVLIPAGLWLRMNVSPLEPNDFWWHVRTGNIILREGAIPVVDLFTFTQFGQPWTNQAWLMQIVWAQTLAAGGVALVIFVHGLIITAGYTIALLACARYNGVRAAAIATFVGAWVGYHHWAVRPQTFSYLAFGLLIYLIEGHRHGRHQLLWWAPLLFAVWGNAHGAFIFGLAALGLYVIGRWLESFRAGQVASRRDLLELAAQGLLSLLALALNPQGLAGMAGYVLGFLQSRATLNFNAEFVPLTIRLPDGLIFAAATLLLLLLHNRSKVRLDLSHLLTLFVFGAMTLYSRRSAPWYGFVLMPVLAAYLHIWLPKEWPNSRGAPAANALVLALLAALVALSLPWMRPTMPALAEGWPLLSETTPVEATEQLCESLPAQSRGFQHMIFASYQVAACPDLPIFMDTRFELYPIEQWLDYLALDGARYDWQEIAARYDFSYFFIHRTEQRHLLQALEAAPGWAEVYRDNQAVIFLRASP